MPGICPESRAQKASIELGTTIVCWDFGSLLVLSLGLVEIPLLLIGYEGNPDQGQHENIRDGVKYRPALGRGAVAGEATGQQQNIGWGCDGEKENTLHERNEDNVHDEEERRPDSGLDSSPSIVFSSNVVTALSIVVVGQAHLENCQLTDPQYVIVSGALHSIAC